MARPEDFLRELVLFFEPLAGAVQSGDALAAFMAELGYDLSNAEGARAALEAIDPPLGATFDKLVDAVAEGGGALSLANDLFRALSALAGPGSNGLQARLSGARELGTEIFDYLTRRYLGQRLPIAVAFLEAVGALVEREIKKSDPDGRALDYLSVRFDWAKLGDFIRDNGQWAADVYGWGKSFDHHLAILNLASLIEASQLATAHVRSLSAAERSVFLKNSGTKPVVGADLPLHQDKFQDVTSAADPVFAEEGGLRVLPYGDLAQPAGLGLAIAPYVKGSFNSTQPITERLSLLIEAGAKVTGGAALALTPKGLSVVNGAAVDASFELGVLYQRPDKKPFVMIGEEGGTRIEAKSALVSVGGSLSGDLFVAGGFEALGATIDVSDDGLLGAVLSGPIQVDAGAVLIGWRNGRGVYFEGGTSLAVTVPLNKDLGPVTLYEIGLLLDWAKDLTIALTVEADLTLGPLYAYVDGLGLEITMMKVADGDGLLGPYDPTFAFKAPTGYAIALDSGVIEGGGMLSVREHEYRGALALRLSTFGFSAFAILNTRLPEGKEGFSFVGAIFTEFSIPLGFGFFLTGLGGIVGLNRTTDTQALRDVLYEGRLDNLLFPPDPIASANTVLDDLAQVFPASEGQHLFGPVAKIGWGQPVLIEGKLGLVLEVGREFRLLVLGGLSSDLPTKETALVSLRLSFFGEIDFAAGAMSIDASLTGSRVLTYSVSGDMALRTGWGREIEHVISFGGLHPRYPRPANLPDLRRMSISFGGNNPRVTLSGYQAITLNSLQFGARASLYAKGPKIPLLGQVAAEGNLSFDALIYFNPFGFDAELGGGLSALVDGDVVAGLGFKLRFTGPNPMVVDGRVWATICGIDVGFGIKHSWGQKKSVPSATADPAALLREAVSAAKGFEPIDVAGRSSGVSFLSAGEGESKAFDPVAGLRLVQRALPLGVAIDKVGEAQLSGSADTFDLVVFEGNKAVESQASTLEFVRGHFWSQGESERLRAPTFETYKAGIELVGGGELAFDAAGAIDETYDYEVIVVGDEATGPARRLAPADAFVQRWGGAWLKGVASPLASAKVERARPDAPILRPTSFVATARIPAVRKEGANKFEENLRATPAPSRTFGAVARSAAVLGGAAVQRNPVAADYLVGNVL